MSRVAKDSVVVPANVEVTTGNNTVTVKGPMGVLTKHCNMHVLIERNEDQLSFKPATNDPQAWAQAGTARANVNNMVKGVTEGFNLTLELVGVGYRAQAKGDLVTLQLGFSHNIDYQLPAGVTAETPNNTTILLKSIDNQLLGQVASDIRKFRPPEPYKGKGVKRAGEVIARKEAKKK